MKYLEPNDSNLLAVIECLVDTNNGSELMVELVVTGSDADTHVTLEQISVFGKGS